MTRVLMRLSTVLFTGLILSAGTGVQAATPESGAITDGQPTTAWTGGPFFLPNATNVIQADAAAEDVIEENSICEEATGQTCDVYRFEVNLSGAIDPEEDLLVITVSWNDSVAGDEAVANLPDYDLELYDDETGELVIQQATGENPEVLLTSLRNGKYRLHVIPYAPMGETYTGVVSVSSYEELSKSFLSFAGTLGGGTVAGLLLAALAASRRRRSGSALRAKGSS